MEVLTRCGRCGALVETRCVDSGFARKVYLAPYVMTGEVSSDGVAPVGDGDAVILCPDCMQQYEDWLVEAPGERHGPGKSPDGDSVDRLAEDLARAVKSVTTLRSQQQLACGYFDHACGIPCLDRGRDVCPAYGDGHGGDSSCSKALFDDVRRRCEALGIDLAGAYDE